MTISITLNPVQTIRLSANSPTVAMRLTGNVAARFSMPLSIRWASIVDPPAELANISNLTTTGFITRTDSDGHIATRTLQAPAAGFTITNPAGLAGDPTFALSDDLAALEAQTGAGIMARTASDTYAHRTITAPPAGITVTDGDGVAGNPTLALADDLAGLESMSGTGLVARIADNAYAQRTLTGPAAGITVTNGDGVAGNPTLALANDLSAYEGLTTTGLVARTGDGTAATRTITAPSAGITVTDGDGVLGDPTLALANDLAALEGLTGTDTIYYRSGVDTWSAVTIGSMLSWAGGTINVGDAELAALAGVTSAADKVPYFTGSGTASVADFTSYGRSIVAVANEAGFKSLVNLEIGTDVQAYSADLAAIAGLAKTDGNIIVGDGTTWVAESDGTARASLGLGTGDSPQFTNQTLTGYLDLSEISAPSNPASNVARFYAKDDGSGVTKLYYKDNAGTETEIGSGGGGTAATQSDMESATSISVFSSPGRQHFHPGHPKAWARWSTAGAIAASYGVSSITDNGNGDWTVNFATAFSTANYGLALAVAGNVSGVAQTMIINQDGANAPTASACRIVNGVGGASNKNDPPGPIWASFFGDQ